MATKKKKAAARKKPGLGLLTKDARRAFGRGAYVDDTICDGGIMIYVPDMRGKENARAKVEMALSKLPDYKPNYFDKTSD
jgi:hypothetical protein